MSDLAVQNRESEQEVMPSFDFLLERETERNTLLAVSYTHLPVWCMWFLYYTAFSLAVEERWDGNFSQSHGLFHRCHPEITMRICGEMCIRDRLGDVGANYYRNRRDTEMKKVLAAVKPTMLLSLIHI